MADIKTLSGIALAEPLIPQSVIFLPQPCANTLVPRLPDVNRLRRGSRVSPQNHVEMRIIIVVTPVIENRFIELRPGPFDGD